jgi:tetratricopeptide (TPR) repeat protein
MRHTWILAWCALAFLCQAEELPDKGLQCIELNNEGVKALNNKDWDVGLEKFEAALKVDPGYTLAHDNITVTHVLHGQQLRDEHKLADALKEFHLAADRHNHWYQEVSETIRQMGKDPSSFEERVKLAEKANATGDHIGAVVEYRAALELKNDSQIHKRLGDEYQFLNSPEKAAAEYGAATSSASHPR